MNTPTNAFQPYDSTALADLILRSSDHVDFYILGAFLRYVSPIFRTMFALNTGQAVEDNEIKDGHPLVYVAEDSNILRLLLDSIYPTPEERCLDDVGLFWKTAKAVARQTLHIPLDSLPYAEELNGITGVGFYRFLEYRFRCSGSRTSSTADEFAEFKSVAQLCLPTDADNVSNASAPFDPSVPVDLILRSSDLVDFFVSAAFIRRMSSVFADIFPLPQHAKVKNGMHIVHVEESSEVLHCLLSIIYHDLDEPDMKETRLYIQVVQAARKYRMTTIEQRLCKQAANSPLTVSDPLRVYITSAALGWEELAKIGALNTFYQPLNMLAYVDELCLINGADLYRLVKYRFRCADAACSALQDDTMFMDHGFGQWNCYFKPNPIVRAPQINPSFACAQVKDSPRGSTISELYSKHLELATSETGELQMIPMVFFNIVRYGRDADKNVESAIAKVDFVKAELFPTAPRHPDGWWGCKGKSKKGV